MATSSSGSSVVITVQRACADQLCTPLSAPGADVVILKLSRTCAKQVLVALTLALGGKPSQKVIPNQGKKKKGKSKGKGKPSGKSTGKTSGTSGTSGTSSTSGRTSSYTTKAKKK